MSLLWRVAKSYADDDDEDWSLKEEPHDRHALHPMFEAAGIKSQPCAHYRCDEEDPEHSAAFDEAERRHFDRRYTGMERFDLSQPVHGFEPTAMTRTLVAYEHFPDAPNVKKPPIYFRYKGQTHIMDGHHRTAAALRRGDSHINVKMIDLDADNWRP
jgi:hypothetical protein